MSVYILRTDQRFTLIGLQADIEALTGLEQGVSAYATDRDAGEHEGTYSGSIWEWATSSGSSAWGAITGTLSDQTDLQAALDAKLDDSQLEDAINNGVTTKAPTENAVYDALALKLNTADFSSTFTSVQHGKTATGPTWEDLNEFPMLNYDGVSVWTWVKYRWNQLRTAIADYFAILAHSHQGVDSDQLDHGAALTGLSDDDHPQYILASGSRDFTGDQSMGNHKLTSVTDPVSAQDAATKSYVDAIAQGLSTKPSAIVGTTTTLPTYTYLSGVITAVSTGVLTIDGHAVALNDYVLVKDETGGNAPYNGEYKCTVAGAVGVAYVLTRVVEMNSSTEFSGAFVFVETGTVNGASGWVCTNTGAVTVGTTNVSFTQFSGAGEITAGSALTKTGNTLDVAVDGSTIEVSSDALRIKDTGVTLAKLANIVDLTILGNNTGGAAAPLALTASQVRTLLALVIGTNVQAYDADLTTWAGLTPSANAQALVTAADYAAMRTLLGLVIGTNVQAWDADLDTLAATPPVGSTYSPTLTNTTNIAASTLNGTFKYIRVGSVVNVVGSVAIDPTAAGNTVLNISLPIASNFTDTLQASGGGSSTGSNAFGNIGSDATNDNVNLTFTAVDLANRGWRVWFQYEIL